VSRPPAQALRLDAPAIVRARFYRALALAVAATRPPAGVVLESTPLGRGAWVTVRPAALVATVRAAWSAAFPILEERPTPPPFEPPAGSVDRCGALIAGPAGPAPPRGGWASEPTDFARLVGASGWLGLQTFWVRDATGALRVARRVRVAAPTPGDLDRVFAAVAPALAQAWGSALGVPAVVVPLARGRRAWRRGAAGPMPPGAWTTRAPEAAAATAELDAASPPDREGSRPTPGPTVVFGASGAGKTTFLGRRAAEAIAAGDRVVVLDLHGDLAPELLARLDPGLRDRTIAIDATQRPVAGIAALPAAGTDGDREAAQLVAALKRLTPDGTDLFWGFRLERIFDSFVRLVQETGGSLLDLYGLLTDADRRDAARLGTRRPDLARFLDELAPVARRNPEFLWSAATRLSKVVLVPALGELLAPADGGLPVEALLAAGRSLVVRLPFAAVGPEAAQFAGTLLLSRLYLGLAARAALGPRPMPVWFVLDEVHGFSPRLVAELVSEGRKFGIRSLIATQYPERLAPELKAAAAGVLHGFVAFRVPRPTAREVGGWLGLAPDEAERVLSELPVGHAVAIVPDVPGPRLWLPGPPAPAGGMGPWNEAVERTRTEFPVEPTSEELSQGADELDERLLLAVLAATEGGRPLAVPAVVLAATELPGSDVDPAALADRWTTLRARGLVAAEWDGCRLTAAGERWLGIGAPTGATRETAQHRALILRALRVFARRGYRLEIVRQGRYDTTLPDAIFRQIPLARRADPPTELARRIAQLRDGWAWRCFGGRDVHVEAEVSGAVRAERIRHGWSKASARGACVVFAVGEAAHARRVRAVLARLGVPRDRAQVWTLPTGLRASP